MTTGMMTQALAAGCIVAAVSGPARAQCPWEWGHMGGFGWGGIMMLLWVALLVLLVYWGVSYTRNRRTGAPPAERPEETPLDILKRRYAKGEITKEEYDRIRRDLED